jgi:nitroimidazol reductase NimA-like FMN-containing flavoprotein (pyridoxamine 5'-phosphate oxidase superfamily)
MVDGNGDADPGFVALTDTACWQLLSQVRVGRLAWAEADGHIVIVPVNFGLNRHTVIIRTGETTLLDAARAATRCAFQAEDLEPGLRSGWTVLLDGTLTEVEDEGDAERLGQLVDPWLREPRPHVLVLAATQATGRCLRAAGGVVVEVEAEERF